MHRTALCRVHLQTIDHAVVQRHTVATLHSARDSVVVLSFMQSLMHAVLCKGQRGVAEPHAIAHAQGI